MKLVVGLGNPGGQYGDTRHNVGFDVLDRLQQQYFGGAWTSRFEAKVCDLLIGTEKVLLFAPQTFMNLSGRSVRAVVDFYKLSVDDVLVVCDDLNLEPGRLRLRAGGSAGGQKGLQNIIEHLGTPEICRVRVGIGRPPGRMDAATYVLKKLSSREREDQSLAAAAAADAASLWVTAGITAAMNQVNGSPPGSSKSETES